MRKKRFVGMLLVAGLMVQACSLSRSVGIGGEPEIQAVFRGGELHATYPARVDRACDQAVSAMRAMGMEVAEPQESVPARKIQARMPSGEPVVITLAPVGTEETMATIRVGAQGDEQASMTIHRAIATRFKKK
jgi:hypothetical protein